MALEYTLILSDAAAPQELLPRAFPEAAERPSFEVSHGVWLADLKERLGFLLNLRQGTRGYFEADAGGEALWTWEPERYLHVGFRLDKEFPRGQAQRNLLAIVARLLATGAEDAALIFNGDTLLLRREAGRLVRCPAQGFWDSLDPQDIPASLSP
jgi:hypothetical protein